MSAVTPAQYAAFLKTNFTGVNSPENVASRDRVFLDMLVKKDIFDGDVLPIPVEDGLNPNRSHTDTIAYSDSNTGASSRFKFVVERAGDYAMVTVRNELMLASRNNKAAWGEARVREVSSMLDSLGGGLDQGLWGDGSGAIGRVLSTSTNTVTFVDPDSAANFQLNQKCTVGANADGTGQRVISSTYITVVSKDEEAGTVTFDDLSTVASYNNASDYFFNYGDAGLSLKGVPAWIPYTTPTSATFWGVNRALDPTRRAGHRLNSTGSSVEDAIIGLASRLRKTKGKPDAVFINPTGFVTLTKELESRGIRPEVVDGMGSFGYKAIKCVTPKGDINVYAENSVPNGYLWMLQMDTWFFAHLGGLPHIDSNNGDIFKVAGAAACGTRAEWFGNLVCTAPAFNGVAKYR